MTKFVLLLVTVAIIENTSAGTPSTPTERGKALLVGSYIPALQVVDGQEIWIRVTFAMLDGIATSSGSELFVEPGHHSLNVRCDVGPRGSVQVENRWGNADIDVEADMAYDVFGEATHSDRYCFVHLVKRS